MSCGQSRPFPREQQQAQDTGEVYPGSWAGTGTGQPTSCQCLLVLLYPDEVKGGPARHQQRECAPALAVARAGMSRLLVPQDVELFLTLGEEALEAEVLPDDWQQLLQQLPLSQTLWTQE